MHFAGGVDVKIPPGSLFDVPAATPSTPQLEQARVLERGEFSKKPDEVELVFP